MLVTRGVYQSAPRRWTPGFGARMRIKCWSLNAKHRVSCPQVIIPSPTSASNTPQQNFVVYISTSRVPVTSSREQVMKRWIQQDVWVHSTEYSGACAQTIALRRWPCGVRETNGRDHHPCGAIVTGTFTVTVTVLVTYLSLPHCSETLVTTHLR